MDEAPAPDSSRGPPVAEKTDGKVLGHRVYYRAGKARLRYTGSSAEHLWNRLNSMDFINRGMLFAAILLLCFFPFLIIITALGGESAVTGLSRHLGLNKEAAGIVGRLFTSPSATSSAISGTSWVFFVLGGIAAATAIQELYERAFEVEGRGMKDLPRRLVWLGALVGCAWLGGLVGPALRNDAGPVVFGVVGLIVITAFWWFTMWLLLGGRIRWRELFPAAVATAIFWVGMEIVFSFIFSSTVITDDKKYGTIGVVFALMSWMIAIGVVIILGAVAGIVWQERGLSFKTTLGRLRRDRRVSDAL